MGSANEGVANPNRFAHGSALAAVLAVYMGVFALGFDWAEGGFFHRYFDQVSYRFEAARVADTLAQGGLAAGVACAWERSTAQGITYPLLGGLAYAAGVDPALAAFAVFLVGLAIVWGTFSELGHRPWLGWLALALIASTTTLLNKTGGPIDFRTDFLGQASWTVAAALAYQSHAFARRRVSIVLGIVLGLAFCTRSLTLAYAAAAMPWCIAAAWIGMGDIGRRRRLANLGIVAAVSCALAAPFFITHFEMMWSYYVDNHISAAENAARGFHGDFVEHLRKYTRSLRKHHLGVPAMVLMAASLLLCLRSRPRGRWRSWSTLLIGAGFLLPIVVMSAGPQFSSTVSGIVAGSTVLLALLPAAGLDVLRPPPRRIATAVVVLGLALWPARFLYQCSRDHRERVAAGHDMVGVQHRAILQRTRGRHDVVLSTLPLIEAHSLAMLELVGYESSGRLPHRFSYGLGHQIYAQPSEQEFERRLRASDVVLWWDGGSSGGDLPANREAADYRALIASVLQDGFEPAAGPAREIVLDGHPVRLYFRSR